MFTGSPSTEGRLLAARVDALPPTWLRDEAMGLLAYARGERLRMTLMPGVRGRAEAPFASAG